LRRTCLRHYEHYIGGPGTRANIQIPNGCHVPQPDDHVCFSGVGLRLKNQIENVGSSSNGSSTNDARIAYRDGVYLSVGSDYKSESRLQMKRRTGSALVGVNC
jgi:hypothetical protein